MTKLLLNPKWAALISLVLAFPLMLLYTTIALDIEVLERPLKSVLTADGERPNAFGWNFMIGSLLLLPIAFVVNFLPSLARPQPGRRRRLHGLTLVVGVVLLVYLSQTWGALFMEQIRCWSGVPKCD